MRYLVAFGRFWYAFIVGDSVVLAIGGGAALGVAAILVQVDGGGWAEWLLPIVVITTLAVSLRDWRP